MDEYVFEGEKIIDKTEKEKEIELIMSIMKAKKDLDISLKNFEYAQDDLIDFYTYQIKATRAKLDFLIKKAKRKGLALDNIKQIQIKYNEAI